MYFRDIYNLLSMYLITNYYLHSFSEKQLRDVPCCYLRVKAEVAPPRPGHQSRQQSAGARVSSEHVGMSWI